MLLKTEKACRIPLNTTGSDHDKAPGEVWRGCETSPFSIKFGGMYGKLAFFGSDCLQSWRKMNSSGQATARKIVRFSGCRSFLPTRWQTSGLSTLCAA